MKNKSILFFKPQTALAQTLAISWKESELKSVDRKTRKYLTMHSAMHPKSDVDRLYIKRKDGGRGLISIE